MLFRFLILAVAFLVYGRAAELPLGMPAEAGLDADVMERIRPRMESIVEDGKVAGAVTMVAKGGKVVYADSVGMRDRERGVVMTEDTIFRIYSMSKPVTGVALMVLFDEGKFRLEDAVCRYLPEFAGQKVYTAGGLVPVEHDMTVLELMTHTGGLTYGVFGNSPVDQEYRRAEILSRDLSLAEMTKRLGAIPLEFQPGSRWLYSVSVDVQGRLVEVLSGMEFEAFLRQRVWGPLGMRDTGFHVPAEKADRLAACYQARLLGRLELQDDPVTSDFLKPPVFKSGGGGMVSTARDYLRFAQMLLNGGELDGKRILRRSTVELMRRNHLPEGVWVQWGPIPMVGTGFGLDFAVRAQPEPLVQRGAFWWTGMATTRFVIWPETGVAAVSMTQRIMDSGILMDPLSEMLEDALDSAEAGTR